MIHKVKPGETLSKIAQANGITLAQLLDANPQFKLHPNDIKVGDELTIPGDDVEPAPQPQPQPVPPGRVLGKLSERFETGGRGPGTVSGGQGDPGGPSYGSYQMTSKPQPGTVGRFVTQRDFAFLDRFRNLIPGTDPFTKAWKEIAAAQADVFQESQHEFIKKTHFDLLVDSIKTQDGLDVLGRSHTLQDVVWSTAVQHGKDPSIVHLALGTVDVSPDDAGFDAALISAIYAERGRTDEVGILVHFRKSSAAVQKGVANRFKEEKKLALNMLRDELAG